MVVAACLKGAVRVQQIESCIYRAPTREILCLKIFPFWERRKPVLLRVYFLVCCGALSQLLRCRARLRALSFLSTSCFLHALPPSFIDVVIGNVRQGPFICLIVRFLPRVETFLG